MYPYEPCSNLPLCFINSFSVDFDTLTAIKFILLVAASIFMLTTKISKLTLGLLVKINAWNSTSVSMNVSHDHTSFHRSSSSCSYFQIHSYTIYLSMGTNSCRVSRFWANFTPYATLFCPNSGKVLVIWAAPHSNHTKFSKF